MLAWTNCGIKNDDDDDDVGYYQIGKNNTRQIPVARSRNTVKALLSPQGAYIFF